MAQAMKVAATPTTKPRGVPKGTKRGPVLTWTDERRVALVQATQGAESAAEITATLKAHPAFADVVDLVTASKVRLQLATLRKLGVGAGPNGEKSTFGKFGRSASPVDVAALNALITG